MATKWASAPSTSGVSWTISKRGSALCGRAAGEAVRELGLLLAQHAHAVGAALVQEPAHPRAAVDGDQHQRRLQRDRHERVRGHAVHLVGLARRDHGHARGEHAQRAPQRDPRVVPHLGGSSTLVRRRDVVEAAVADPVRPGPDRRAAQREVELRGRLGGPGHGLDQLLHDGVTKGHAACPRTCSHGRPLDRTPPRAAHREDLQRGEAAVPRGRDHQGRAGRLLRGGRARDGAAHQGPPAQPVALERGDRQARGHPAGDPEGRPGVGQVRHGRAAQGRRRDPCRGRRAGDPPLARPGELRDAARVAEPRRPPRLPRPPRLRPRPARRGRRSPLPRHPRGRAAARRAAARRSGSPPTR